MRPYADKASARLAAALSLGAIDRLVADAATAGTLWAFTEFPGCEGLTFT